MVAQMTEFATQYTVAQPPHARVPERWLRFLFRVAQLEAGRVYTITVIVPSKPDSEPQWAISDGSKVENAR